MGLVNPTPVVKHIPLHVCTEGSSSSTWEDAKSFDKTIYRRLSMQDDLKTIEAPDRIRTEFDKFLEEASKKTANEPYNQEFEQLNEYLGNIGVTDGIC